MHFFRNIFEFRLKLICTCFLGISLTGTWLGVVARSGAGAHFINDFSITIQLWWKFHVTPIHDIMKWTPQKKFLHMARQFSCNLVTSDWITAMRSFHQIWIVSKIPLEKQAPDNRLLPEPTLTKGRNLSMCYTDETSVQHCPGALLVSILTSNKTWRTRLKRSEIFKWRFCENYATFCHDVSEWFFRRVYEVINGQLAFFLPMLRLAEKRTRRFCNVTRNFARRDGLCYT